jgi:hypothetical protein
VILAAGYVYVTSLARGDENSQFNQNTRFQLGKYAITRTIFGLHNAGDARAEYFSRGNLISVEIVQPENSGFSDEILNNFSDKIKNYILSHRDWNGEDKLLHADARPNVAENLLDSWASIDVEPLKKIGFNASDTRFFLTPSFLAPILKNITIEEIFGLTSKENICTNMKSLDLSKEEIYKRLDELPIIYRSSQRVSELSAEYKSLLAKLSEIKKDLERIIWAE